MDCDDAALDLPALLNGTLESAAALRLREHLATCETCRQELQETEEAAAVFAAHIPASVLMDRAWDRPAALDADLVSRHLEQCPECAEELELARESRRQETPTAVSRPRRANLSSWAGLPASLAAGLVLGIWWGTTRAPAPARDDGRVTVLEAELARLREAEQGLRAELDGARRPQLNLPVFELFSAEETRRSSGSATNEVTVPPDAGQIAFVLSGETAAGAPATIEIRDARQGMVWSGEGLRPGPLGVPALAVPRALLPEGDYVLVVRAPGRSTTTYAIRVRPQRRELSASPR